MTAKEMQIGAGVHVPNDQIRVPRSGGDQRFLSHRDGHARNLIRVADENLGA